MLGIVKKHPIITILVVILLAYVGFTAYWNVQNNAENKRGDSTGSSETKSKQELPANDRTLYKAVNKERTKRGLNALQIDHRLVESARLKCNHMVKHKYYDHFHPRTGESGYGQLYYHAYIGENLNGKFTLKHTIKSWMGSPAHRENMLDPYYKYTGIAICEYDGVPIQVQHFAELLP